MTKADSCFLPPPPFRSEEEEDLTLDCTGNYISLGETSERKGGNQIQSQLEVLTDSFKIAHGTEPTNSLNKGQTGYSSKDEVEVPFFHDDGKFTCSPEMASISNINEGAISIDGRVGLTKLGSQKPDEASMWSAINKEAEALANLTENARSSSMLLGSSFPKKPHKGGRDKAKPKLLFRFQSQREDTYSSLGCKNEVNVSSRVFSLLEELKGVNRSTTENTMPEPLIEGGMIDHLGDCGVHIEPVFGCGHTNRSMVDLLDSYQDRNDALMENIEMTVDEGSISPVDERELDYAEPREALDSGSSSEDEACLPMNAHNLGIMVPSIEQKTMTDKFEDVYGVETANKELDYAEPPEALDNGSSSEDEACLPMNAHNLGIMVPSTEQKTMTDKFEEVFGVKTANKEGPDYASHGTGVFGKLQQVMQSDKKKEIEFLKRMQTCGNFIDETSCIDVEILSRCLEAKLIVCRCSLGQEKKHCRREENPNPTNGNQNMEMVIIFSTRVCDDVELEIGNLVRIYSPWKEVQVGEKDELIILSTFFSQLSFF